MTASLAGLIAAKGYVVADGAMGTQLFAAGLCAGDPPEMWNVTQPEKIRDIHRAYVRAGAEVLVTNSFGGNRFRLALHYLQNRVAELNEAAARNARVAIEAEAGDGKTVLAAGSTGPSGDGDSRTVLAAGSTGPSGDGDSRTVLAAGSTGPSGDGDSRTVLVAGSMGPSGELLTPMGNMTPEACEAAFAEQAEALAAGGADLLWIETMSDLDEVEAAVRGARSACDLPVAATMSFDTAGRTMMGVTGAELAERLGGLGLAAIGANCGNNVADTEAAVIAITAAAPGVPVISKPNAGVPVWSGDALVYDGTPEVMAAHAHRARAAGVAVLGSCCGSTPDHTAKIAAVLRGDEPPPEVEAPRPDTPRAGTEDRLAQRRTRRRTS